MLEMTFATRFVPGSNVKGRVAGANWCFLLPALELDRILCIGAPSYRTLSMLAQRGRTVDVVCPDRRTFHKVLKARQRAQRANVQPITAERYTGLPDCDGPFDLVVIADRRAAHWFHHDCILRKEILRLLHPDGRFYFEYSSLGDRHLRSKTHGFIEQHFRSRQIFWLTPLFGETRTAVLKQDQRTTAYFCDNSLHSPSLDCRLIKRAQRLFDSPDKTYMFARVQSFLSKELLLTWPTRRFATLAGRHGSSQQASPPQYLRSIARSAGINIDRHRWGLSATGRYSSRKILFFLFARDSAFPEYVVKMVRDCVFNSRLENETRSLVRLYELGISDRQRLPQVEFFGHHGGLAIVGESVVRGVPFRQKTKMSHACPYAGSAIDWIIELGSRTVNHSAIAPSAAARQLQALLAQFQEIYSSSAAERDFLSAQISAIARCEGSFPVVFQHGDPGTWNVVVTPSDKAAFLDWEAAEPQGIPLWDLYYFLRSYAVGVARRSGTRDSLDGIVRQLMMPSPLADLTVKSVRRYCVCCNVPPSLIEPLFYICWMHRALKEATRLVPSKINRGHYVNLLRWCINHRDAPTLRLLFMQRDSTGTHQKEKILK